MMKLALAIIAKDEAEKVANIVRLYGKYFEEIAVAADGRLDEFAKIEGVSVYPYEWRNDFAHKRNWLAERIKSEYYLRMDTDDLLGNPEAIPGIFQTLVANNIDVFYSPYDYAKDEHDNVIARHWRETIIRKRPDVYWKKAIHENIFMEDQDGCRITRSDKLRIIHDIDSVHAAQSSERNFKYLLEEFKNDGEQTDPRTLAYLGRMLMGQAVYDKAIFFLEKLVEKSGWDDDKYFAWVQMSQCYQFLGKYDLAISCCNEALAINTKFPDAYLQMGSVYLCKEDYQKAVDWIMPGIVRPEPDTVMVLDPSFYSVKARLNAAMALLGKGDAAQALKYFEEARKISPKDPDVLKHEGMFRDADSLAQYVNSLMWMALYTKSKEPAKCKVLMEAIPKSVYRDERIWSIRNSFVEPKVWDDKEIVFYCGSSWEEWSPVSVLKGIGGSEEAVIYLSKELTRLGYKVTVFNNCGEMAGIYDGVEYKPFQSFNPKDRYATLIGWRGNHIRDVGAKRKYIWLHDVPYDGMFSRSSIEGITKIIVLSEFHRSLLPDYIPDSKVFISRNGINTDEFAKNGIVRDPKRLIYTSSYDRGLEHLLRLWPDVKKEVPEVTLHIFYGWDLYDRMIQKGARDPEFRRTMTILMNQDGITEHGRVGHRQLVDEFMKSGVWAYPSHFEEISCISAMKAQAAGCVPVCTDYAALNETVKAGIKVEGSAFNAETRENYGKRLIQILKEDEAQEEKRKEVIKHKGEFGWDGVAKQWAESLF